MYITVVGSINLDVVAQTDHYPEHGETRFGKAIAYWPGGKAANQAVAIAKLGKNVQLIGSVGNDVFGQNLLNHLNQKKINTRFVKRSERFATGTAMITIDQTGENTILVVKGANDDLLGADIEHAFSEMETSNILLVQMEVPHETVIRAMQLAKAKGMYVILDPAPADGVVLEALKYADIITPNQQETKHLLGLDVTDFKSAVEAGQQFEKLGVRNSIIKMGKNGSVVYQSGSFEQIKPIKVNVVDTLGAGDAFAGALAAALSEGQEIETAAKIATIVSGLKVTKRGAQAGSPTREEVHVYYKNMKLPDDRLPFSL